MAEEKTKQAKEVKEQAKTEEAEETKKVAETKKWSSEIKKLGDKIVGLTLMQAKELGDYLKDEYSIEPAGGAVMVAGPAAENQAEQAEGRVVVDLAVAGGWPHGVSGSGALAVVQLRALARGEVEVGLAEGVEVRDADNQPVELRAVEACVVVVE